MLILLYAISLLLASGLLAWVFPKPAGRSTCLGVGGTVAGCAMGLVPSLRVLMAGSSESVRFPWHVPGGSFFVQLDALSAFFLCLIFGISALCAIYGAEYLEASHNAASAGGSWFFFNTLVASMALVVLARNVMLFLLAWEVMALASFFLVTLDHGDPAVRRAGWIYLVATHLGTAFLLVLFVLLGRGGSGALDFDGFVTPSSPHAASVLFLLAVIGFGVKAGLMPFHVWLPEAHPAAPSHVSAVMSGVMIKTGIYGLVRILPYLGPPPAWWGGLLIGLGAVSGVWGVLLALAQHDLKRLLAYHSVENIGIITLGLGAWLLGVSLGSPLLSVLGLAGALFHVLNHAVFKSLLFLGAGAVARQTGTREIDRLGGLLKVMPWTGVTFLIAAAAISGLPPLNGFASEFLIYFGAYQGILSAPAATGRVLLVIIAALALIGGLAAACFTKAFGVVFLGEPRRLQAETIHEVGSAMRWPMVTLAAACIVIGLLAPWGLALALPGILMETLRLPSGVLLSSIQTSLAPLRMVVVTMSALIAVMLAVLAARRRLLAGRTIGTAATWGCGYRQPSSRMQYTASSFARPIVSLFQLPLRMPNVYEPCFRGGERVLKRFRWLQHGRVQLYVLYIMVTLLVLFLWKLGS